MDSRGFQNYLPFQPQTSTPLSSINIPHILATPITLIYIYIVNSKLLRKNKSKTTNLHLFSFFKYPIPTRYSYSSRICSKPKIIIKKNPKKEDNLEKSKKRKKTTLYHEIGSLIPPQLKKMIVFFFVKQDMFKKL